MKTLIKSLAKNKAKNIIYVVLLFTVFAVVIIIVHTLLLGMDISAYLDSLYVPLTQATFADADVLMANRALSDTISVIDASFSSLVIAGAPLMLICILMPPFLYRLFIASRGYEIGILRALGLSKSKAWRRLIAENMLLTGLALLLAIGASYLLRKPLAFALLAIRELEAVLVTEHGVPANMLNGFSGYAVLIAAGLAVAAGLIAAVLCNTLVAKNDPLKLIRNFK